MAAKIRKEYGQYVVSDLKICHGHLTFKGTRILVKDVLFYVGQGKDWDWIIRAYDGGINREGIAEAIDLANQTLIEKIEKPRRAQVERALGPVVTRIKANKKGSGRTV